MTGQSLISAEAAAREHPQRVNGSAPAVTEAPVEGKPTPQLPAERVERGRALRRRLRTLRRQVRVIELESEANAVAALDESGAGDDLMIVYDADDTLTLRPAAEVGAEQMRALEAQARAAQLQRQAGGGN